MVIECDGRKLYREDVLRMLKGRGGKKAKWFFHYPSIYGMVFEEGS